MNGAPLSVMSWNVFSDNEQLDALTRVVLNTSSAPPDVVCLQEVPGSFLPQLRALEAHEYHISTAEDFHKKKNGGLAKKYYLVTLTQVPPDEIRAYRYTRKTSIRSLCARIWGVEEGKEFLSVDITHHGIPLRIFNIHFDAFSKSRWRLLQLRRVLRRLSRDRHNFIVGDFNVSDRWYRDIFHFFDEWIVTRRFSWKDLKIKERESFEHRLRIVGLKGLFKAHVTRPCFWGDFQLDDIVVPEDVEVVALNDNRGDVHGSDHHILSSSLYVPPIQNNE
jgi:endonuclease/exonuclease/phosphatase family metal-dependent hydrolase